MAGPGHSSSTSIETFGYSLDEVARMASVGFLLNGVEESAGDGRVVDVISFSFIPDSPMGRINRAAGFEDRDLLDRAIEDARFMSTSDFASKYRSFGPYEAS
jgi:hypothetical protein